VNTITVIGRVESPASLRRIQDKWDAAEFKMIDEGGRFPMRIAVEVFGSKAAQTVEEIRPGLIVAVKGEATAEAYINKRDSTKAVGVLKVKNAVYQIIAGPSAIDPGEDEGSTNEAPARKGPPPWIEGKGYDDLPF